MPLIHKIPLWPATLQRTGAAQADVTLRLVDQPGGMASSIMVKDGMARSEDADCSENGITICV